MSWRDQSPSPACGGGSGWGAAALALLLTTATPHALAQTRQDAWQREKCAAYATAWTEAQRRFGTAGLGPSFIDGHAAFLASGCRTGRDICPRTAEELAMADRLTVAAMNTGTASTFPPFRCR